MIIEHRGTFNQCYCIEGIRTRGEWDRLVEADLVDIHSIYVVQSRRNKEGKRAVLLSELDLPG